MRLLMCDVGKRLGGGYDVFRLGGAVCVLDDTLQFLDDKLPDMIGDIPAVLYGLPVHPELLRDR